jgi:hypothetical protein
MTVKVEVGFDLTDSPIGPFLTLNDPIAGKLDDSEWTLAGTIFVDVTEYVQTISISRGKSRLLDKFQAGSCQVVFNNTNRFFDPTFTDSPYFGNIIPRREIRVSIEDEFAFFGVVDDWNLDYQQQGKQTATAVSSDGFTKLTNQTLTGGTQTPQKSGERVNDILDDPGVDWPGDRRNIDTGAQNIGADVIEQGANALSYLQLVETSEPGRLFIGKDGFLNFKDRTVGAASTDIVALADDGTGIPFQIVSVEFGSELLFNQVNISSVISGETATANRVDSQTNFGIITLSQDGLLMSTTFEAQQIADFYANRYSQPEFRFRQVDVLLDTLTSEQKLDILQLELGDVCSIKFTPGTVGDPIDRLAEVISIEHTIAPTEHSVRFGFSTLDFTSLVLDDTVFGRLDAGNALAF